MGQEKMKNALTEQSFTEPVTVSSLFYYSAKKEYQFPTQTLFIDKK